jgi:transposase
MPTPTAVVIELTDEERGRLEAWARRGKTAQALAMRSRIVLAAAGGAANFEIAEQLGISRPTVTKWRNRFADERLEGLLDEPRPGRPRTVTDEQVELIVTTTLESTPKGATHWSTRSLAKYLGVSQGLGVAHLAGVQSSTPPPREVQALRRPAVRREGL